MRSVASLLFLPLCAAQSLQLSPNTAINKMVVDSAGNVYVAQLSTISKLNPGMTAVQWAATVPFVSTLAMGMSSSGTLAVAGLLTVAGLVVQLDPNTGNTVSGTLFSLPASVTPAFAAITPAGNVVISSGGVSSPATAGAVSISGLRGYVMKLDPNGKVLWSASGISGVVTVDSSENVYVAGTGSSFPATAGAYRQAGSQYIAKLSADGTKVVFASYLSAIPSVGFSDMAVSPDGSIYAAGLVSAAGYSVTPGALVGTFPAQFTDTLSFSIGPPCGLLSVAVACATTLPYSGFVSRLSADGSTLLYSTYLGGSQRDNATSIAVGADGSMVVTGIAFSPDFPGLPAQLSDCMPGNSLLSSKQRDFLIQVSADGTRIENGQLIGATNPGQGIACVVDAADTSYADTISLGELITINGFGVGPAAAQAPGLANPAMEIGGVSVMFGSMMASLSAAGGTLITAAVPRGLPGGPTTMTVLHNGQAFDSRTINVTTGTPSVFVLPANGKSCNAPPPAVSGVFTGGSPTPAPMILNADGTINVCDNPAEQGSTVTLFLNGLGGFTPTVTINGGLINVLSLAAVGNPFQPAAAVSSVSIQVPSTGTSPVFLGISLNIPALAAISDYQSGAGIPLYWK
jgi:uncharacterized protein (TIGR03437 family)